MVRAVALLAILVLVPSITFGVKIGSITVDNIDNAVFNTVLKQFGTADLSSYGIWFNRGLDVVLDFLNQDLRTKGNSEVKLPDIYERFRRRFLWFSVSGHFKASRGYFRDLASLQRRGDTTVVQNNLLSYTVSTSIGLGTVSLGYGHYNIMFGGPSISGRVNGEVGPNSIRVQATVALTEKGECSINLDQVKVVQLDGLRVNIAGTGLGLLNWVKTAAANSFARNQRGKIISSLEVGLANAARKELARIRCKL